jgi:subtilisin family serine protease
LQNVYMIETNDIRLMHELKIKGSKEFRNLVELKEPELLYTPNDYGGEPNSSIGSQTNLDLINVKKAWDITKGIPEVVIAIHDTYLDISHVELLGKANMVLRNTDSYSGYALYHAHGTEATGIIAAYTDNYTGMAGIAYKCGFIFSSFFDYFITESDYNQLLELSMMGVKVINVSWHDGVCVSIEIFQEVAKEIRENGTVLVASAGNNNCGGRASYVYPASYNDVISVTSVGHLFDHGHIDPVYGPNNWKDVHEEVIGNPLKTHHHNDKVDICAPGYNVPVLLPNNQYGGDWGTSFAAPHVAAVCGLIMSANVCLTPDEVENVLKTTAVNIDAIPENVPYAGLLGAGRVDAYAAVLKASEMGTYKLQYRYINTLEEYAAPYAMKVGRDVTVGNGGNLKLKAKHQILINDNFEIQAGGLFEMYAHEDIPITCL